MSYLHQEPSPRNFDKLQERYNQQAGKNWNQQRRKKNLYYRVVQLQQANMDQRRRMERQLKSKQDQKIKQFWKADRDRYMEEQRRKKQQIDQVRKTNQSMSMEIMNSSKVREEYIPHNDFNQFYYNQMQKQKKQQQKFLKNAQEYQEYKKELSKHEKQIQIQVQKRKEQQQRQIQKKRQADLRRIRQKHQQNFSAYHNLEEHMKMKERDEEMLEQYIVNKGQNDQQAKLLAKRLQFEAKQKQKRQNFIRQLKGQLDSHNYQSIIGRKLQIENERNLIDQRNRYFSQMDRINRLRKSQQNQHMLEVLKNQVKPRKLLADPQVIEQVGSGSPVNIGKVMGDDRKRQLDWIQKSLLRQVHY